MCNHTALTRPLPCNSTQSLVHSSPLHVRARPHRSLRSAAETQRMPHSRGKIDRVTSPFPLVVINGATRPIPSSDRTPLHLAAGPGHLDCMRLLVNYQANLNAIDRREACVACSNAPHMHLLPSDSCFLWHQFLGHCLLCYCSVCVCYPLSFASISALHFSKRLVSSTWPL